MAFVPFAAPVPPVVYSPGPYYHPYYHHPLYPHYHPYGYHPYFIGGPIWHAVPREEELGFRKK